MAYALLPLVNGDAEVAVAAPWTNVVGAASSIVAARPGSVGTHIFTWAGGNFDFQQDVAVPAGEWAAIDAGARRVLYSAWVARAINPTPTITLNLYALSATNVVLQTWTYAYNGSTWENWQLEETVPALTRAFRVRANGFDWGERAYFDDAVLALDDFALRVGKGMAYVVEGFPLQTTAVEKAMAYGIIGPAAGPRIGISKAMLYAVFGPGSLMHVTKAMAYAVIGPSVPPGDYPGEIILCSQSDRPINEFVLCATRPDTVMEPCATRGDGTTFYPDQPYTREH